MIFAFPTAILSEYVTDRPSLLFLPTKNSSTCLIRSQCGPNRTEYKVNNGTKTEQQRYLWIKNHVDFWDSITHQSTVFKYFWDTKQPPGLHVVFIRQLGKWCWRGASPEVSSMSLDTLPIIAQELQKYQGLREFFSTPTVSPSIQHSVSFTTSSNTIWSCYLSFSVKAEEITFLLPWHW